MPRLPRILTAMEFQVDGFILYLATERGLSTAYQLSVRQTLDKLVEWTSKQGYKEWRDLGTDELSAFLGHLRKGDLDTSSLRIALVHLKIFFRFLQKRNHIEIDPAEPLLAPKTSAKLPETLNAETITQLLSSINPEKKLGKRDLALLELFYASGLRLSEICNARLEFLDV
ncbi:site-specific integrase, partial [Akkermansiaceae bacterium]|nr:site-specific integrase [Akkermansiaceae bacterium]